MADSTVSDLAVFDKGKKLNFIEENGEILFTAEEIGRHLGYSNPAEAINRLYQRNQNELKHYTVSVKLTATDGKSYDTRTFSEEGVFIISMLARTNDAKKFRARVALLLRRLRRERAARALELAREAGYFQGKDEALSLPVMEAERKKGYLEGLKEGRNFRKERDGLVQLGRALKYRNQGLSQHEIACLLGVRQQRISELFAKARKLGMSIPQAKPTPMRRRQGNLLEVKA